MILDLNLPELFANVTQAQIDEVLADQAANHKRYGNTFNWYWHHCLQIDGKIHPKFWNNVMVKHQTTLSIAARMWIAKNGKPIERNVLLAAALKEPARQVMQANPSRLTVKLVEGFTSQDVTDGLRAQGMLIEL